jgi:hypothetical protein
MARLTAGSHFANKRARAVGYIDVRENIDAVIGARRLDLDVVKLDRRHLLDKRTEGSYGPASQLFH